MKKLLQFLTICAVVIITAGNVWAQVTIVGDPYGGNPYATIQAAINACNGGETINVAAGNYTENVDIGISITLHGAGAASCTVTAAVTTDHVLHVDAADNGEISGFTITGASGTDQCGIYMYNSDNWLISYNTITQNDKGIKAEYCQYNTIRDNQIINNNSDGVWLSGCKGNTIQDNDITNNGWIGIYLTDSGVVGWENDDNEIISNTIEYNATTGIEIDAGANNLIQNNDIRNNGTSQASSGILLWGYIPPANGNSVLNNLIEGNSKDGVTLFMGCVNTLIQENDILSNGGSGIYQAWSDAASTYDNSAHYNNISGNTGYGVRNSQTVGFDATKNWWGDATGADHSSNPHGTGQGGDAVSDNVDFTPWYATSTTTSSTQYVTVTHNPVIAYSDKIQGGIDAALAGDIINVADGTYTITAAITVNKGVTINGNTGSPENVVVTYGSASQTLDCFDMQTNDITVQGIKVVNGRYGFNFAASDPTGCTISNCVIDHCYEGAINIDGGSGHTISNNTITSCLTSGTKRGAIHIFGCPDVTINGNTLTGNGLTGAHATMGIYVKFTYPSSSNERVEVINNNISGMLGSNADIQVYDAPYTYIYNNTISNSEDKGIAIFGIEGNPAYTSIAKRVEVIGNNISETNWGGIQACNAPYTYIYNNTINGTDDKGINIIDSDATGTADRTQVIGNTISLCKWQGIQVIGAPHTYVYDNTLTKCNYYGGDGTGDFDYASIHIETGSSNCLIDSNTVSDGINGIQLWSDNCTVTNNTIYDMGKTYADKKTTVDGTYYNSAILYGDMYNVNMPTSATISNNNIHDNYRGLFVISAYTGPVVAEYNYWGDNTGPYHSTNPGGLGDTVSGNVDFDPWKTTIYNQNQGVYYVTIQDAITGTNPNDTIILDCGTYYEQLTINTALTLTSDCSTSILDGTTFKGGTGITVTSPGVIIHNQTIQNWDTGIVIISPGNATIDSCKIMNNADYGVYNDNTAVVIDAEHNWWGDASGPSDNSDDRATGGYYNPGGTGDTVSDYIDYYPWYISDALADGCVGIGIYNPSCAYLEVKVTPDSDMNGTITVLVFTVSWDASTVSLIDITPSYGITLQYQTTSGGKNYAVFGMFMQNVNWTAGTEYTILTFRHDESDSGTSDFEIATDTWAFANNASYYLEYWGSNYTGLIYAIAEDVYLASCDIEVKAKVLLQGPYNTSTNLMNTDLQTNGDVPIAHPYGVAPWNFPGSETVDPIPANYVDWVLVELRDVNDSANVIDKSVGLLFNDGTIKDTSLTNDIRFNNIMPLTDYFIAVWHRNHMPVMSEAAVNIPNAAVYNFSDTLNFPPHGGGNNALVNLETGVYGMIAGDVNNDGRLMYSGANNDRGEILDTIVSATGNSSITGTIQGYYWEDLTMNDEVKYSGVGNDQRLIILNLIELTGVYSLTSVYNSLVPGAVNKAGTFGPHTGPFDVALAENSDFLEVMIITKEEIKDGFIDNIQFTLSWDGVDDEIDEMINKYQSDYKIEPQGSIVMQKGRKYQIFAVVDWMALPNPLNVGEDIVVLRFDKNNVTGTLAKRIEIAEDSFTNSNNGDYYISLIGKDHTGEILDYTVLSAEETAGQNAYVKYYPNPSNKGKVTMNFVSGSTGEFTISITDISSREVWQQTISVNGNKPYIEVLDLQGLNRGVYIIRVKGAGIVMNDKLIIN